MGRYAFPAFNTSPSPRYIVLWDLQWQMLACQRLEPAADLSGAMTATIEGLSAKAGKLKQRRSMASHSCAATASAGC